MANEKCDGPLEMVVVKMGFMSFWSMESFPVCNGYNLKAIQQELDMGTNGWPKRGQKCWVEALNKNNFFVEFPGIISLFAIKNINISVETIKTEE